MLEVNKLVLAGILATVAVAGCTKGPDNQTAATPSASAGADQKAADANDKIVVATVNGKPITKALLDAYIKQVEAAQPPGTIVDPKTSLDDMISREVIYQDALKEGLDQKPDQQALMANMDRNILANAALHHYLVVNDPKEDALKAEYQSSISKDDKEYKAKHIVVKTEAEAKAIIAQLDKGASFDALAKQQSLDKVSGKDGGELGWFAASQMVKPFTDAVRTLAKGQYTKTPVQSNFGWHVILLEDTRPATPPTYEKIRPSILAQLQTKLIKEYLEQLKKNAKIDIKLMQLPPGMGVPAGSAPAATAVAPAQK